MSVVCAICDLPLDPENITVFKDERGRYTHFICEGNPLLMTMERMLREGETLEIYDPLDAWQKYFDTDPRTEQLREDYKKSRGEE